MLRAVSLKKNSAKCQKVRFLHYKKILRRIGKRYDDGNVIVKSASNDGLTILRAVDKENAQKFIQETLQEVWETADGWFVH